MVRKYLLLVITAAMICFGAAGCGTAQSDGADDEVQATETEIAVEDSETADEELEENHMYAYKYGGKYAYFDKDREGTRVEINGESATMLPFDNEYNDTIGGAYFTYETESGKVYGISSDAMRFFVFDSESSYVEYEPVYEKDIYLD